MSLDSLGIGASQRRAASPLSRATAREHCQLRRGTMKEFPPFHLDTVNQCLWRGRDRTDQERVLLTPRAYALLRYLVEHPGRLLTHDELLDALWPNTHVQPEVLKGHIFEVRTALGDDSKKPLFIETLPRRGYRFIAPVSDGAAP